VSMPKSALCFMLAAVLLYAAAPDSKAADTIELTPTEAHHIIELGSNQPYVAGYYVGTPDLYTIERVNSTAITVSFPSTDPSYFPSGSWLGAGMFVQAQDTKLKHVDYAFYTMLVLDSQARLFLDIGLHQTRESSAPLQMATEELLYGYTWQISGIDPATPVTLLASWNSTGFVEYSLSALGTNVTVASIDVAGLPKAASIIRRFYTGNYIAGQGFPFGHFVYYFQFGVVSSVVLANNHWSACLREPWVVNFSKWQLVEAAWSTQGDVSYLDWDWTWGGAPYHGVSAQYHKNPLQNPYEVIFSYTGKTLPPGTILWENREIGEKSGAPPTIFSQPLGMESTVIMSFEIMMITAVTVGTIHYHKLRKKDSADNLNDGRFHPKNLMS